MKKIVFFLILILLVFMVQGEEKVEIKYDAAPFWYGFMEFQGSYVQTPESIRVFLQELGKQKLQSQLRGQLFGLYPQGGEQKFTIGIQISEATSVKLPLKKTEYKYKKVARYIYKGPYELIGNAYGIIFPTIGEKGYVPDGPIMNRWLDDDPDQVKPENRQTEIIIPVKKRSK